jgi:hypothetical protein
MKKLFYFFFSAAILFSFTSCLKDSCTQTQEFRQFTPVWMTPEQIREEVKPLLDRPLEVPGKIYFYKNYILINEIGRGIHFYDNTDPKLPVKKVFYDIPGNVDMAIKDDILIADDAYDLRSIDISDIMHPKTISRHGNYKNQVLGTGNPQILAFMQSTDVVNTFDCSNSNFGQSFFTTPNGIAWASGDVAGFALDSKGGGGLVAINSGNSAVGIGGSFARFAIYDQYLYAVNQTNLTTLKLEKGIFNEQSRQQLGWGIETIFPYKDKLFIGSNSGMFIFDNSKPSSPKMLSQFQHSRACDPVVVNETTAYVTLRNGNDCQGFVNQLDVVDITNLSNPKLIKSYPMKHPHGLSLSDKTLYICEGQHGLKTLDVTNNESVSELAFDKSVKSYDVIALGDKRLLMIGSDGFYQYDATNPSKLELLSKILVAE